MRFSVKKVFYTGGVLGLLVIWGGCAQRSHKTPSVKKLFKKAVKESRVLQKGPAERTVEKYGGQGTESDPAETKRNEPGWLSSLMPEELSEVIKNISRSSSRSSSSDSGEKTVPGRGDPSGPKVSTTFTQTDVRQALRSIANQAGVSVIMDRQVDGVVSAVIQDEPFEEALRRVLLPLGLVYRKIGQRYYVGVPDPSSSLFSKISVRRDYRVKQLGPEQLLNLLPERYKKFVRVSPQQQLIMIEAPQRIAHEIRQQLKKSDQPVRQVVIEAIVAVFAPDTRFRFGLDFSQGIRVRGDDFMNLTMEDLALTGKYGGSQFSEIRNFSFTSTFLQALDEEGYLTIRAAPRVMARDGKTAKIRIGRQTFFNTQPQPQNRNFIVNAELEEVESGIVLNMKPQIRGNRVIINLKKAEVSEEIRTTQQATALNTQFPVINRREVNTTVSVENGKTIVIGGLVQRQVVNQKADIPYVSNIPLLGWIFHERDVQEQSREVAVFLSPRIVKR